MPHPIIFTNKRYFWTVCQGCGAKAVTYASRHICGQCKGTLKRLRLAANEELAPEQLRTCKRQNAGVLPHWAGRSKQNDYVAD